MIAVTPGACLASGVTGWWLFPLALPFHLCILLLALLGLGLFDFAVDDEKLFDELGVLIVDATGYRKKLCDAPEMVQADCIIVPIEARTFGVSLDPLLKL